MDTRLEEFEKQARQFSLRERSVLVDRLINSLEDVDEKECERLWLEEAHRRYEGYKAGTLASCSAEDALQRVRDQLREVR